MDNRNLRSALCCFTCTYCPKLIIHSNQIKIPIASTVEYIISRMSQPFCKVFSLCTGTQNTKSIHIKCFPRANFTSRALEKTINLQTQNSIPLRYVNKIMTESVRPLWEMMLTFFEFLKSSGLCCQNETHNKVCPITLILKMSISGLLYASYLVLLIDRNNIENYLTVIRY